MRLLLAALVSLTLWAVPAHAQIATLTNYPSIPACQVDIYMDGSWHLRHGGHWFPVNYAPSPVICQGVQDWLNPSIDTWGVGMYAYPDTVIKGYPVQGFVQWFSLTTGGAAADITYNVGGACNAARTYHVFPGPGSPGSPYSLQGLNVSGSGGGCHYCEMTVD